MSRYTPKHRRPTTKPTGTKKKAAKVQAKKPKPAGKFICKICEKGFRTEEALATHALDAHGQPLDLNAMSPVAPNMVRCPECGMPVRKRNLQQHLRFIHELVG